MAFFYQGVHMKPLFVKTAALIALTASLSACNGLTQTQRNTATGAVIGGVAGNLIGGDTGSTLGGAALGGVIGSQVHRHR
ncbi:rickettsia surface antigen superfamily protein [Neisseria bacilliformis ATCC BAA-1200]|uniref:Rickettsia surface antigen superfamily protein n=2 Tax=Neisseria TaxID=482 RepID=F2B928_9NEIS|nr:rickettsia surface antigen superfamily protein [Neisseria bacilliformis ATCC BAA-1200]